MSAPPPFDAATVRARQVQCKQAAVYFKRQNDLGAARDWLKHSKACDVILEKLELVNEGLFAWADVQDDAPPLPPPPPPQLLDELAGRSPGAPAVPLPPAASLPSPASLAAAVPGATGDVVAHLIEALTAQSAACTAAAAYYLGKSMKQEALTFHRMKKAFGTDLAALHDALARGPGAVAPVYEYRDVRFHQELSCPDLNMFEYEVQVKKATGLGAKAVTGDLNCLVIWDVGFPENEGKGETPAVTSSTPDVDFDYAFKVKIERNKQFQRHLERKRASFEVLHRTGGLLGFFSSRISLGRAQVKLDSLLTKAEIHQVLPLTDANRRSTGGSLEIKIRMRQPLQKPDIVERQERWIFIQSLQATPTSSPVVTMPASGLPLPSTPVADGPVAPPAPLPKQPSPAPPRTESPAHALPSPKPLPPVPAIPAAAPTASPPPPATAPSTSPAPASAPPTSSASSAPSTTDDLQDLIDWFENPDTLVSNLVLDAEMESLAKGITAARAARDSATADALEDRRSACQVKLTMLQLNVEMGVLTMDKYRAQLVKAIVDAKPKALALKRMGRVDLAARTLARIKLMQQECSEIDQMMAAGGEEE
ncbi:Coiled-coil and C2 domain-containing protein 1B [Allomyces arbusculus]|nr:Coiled-coil and C2 domain-containing protein 1B [Allomyces arbusculus]